MLSYGEKIHSTGTGRGVGVMIASYKKDQLGQFQDFWEFEEMTVLRRQSFYDHNILWSSDIFKESECPCPRFSEYLKIVGSQK